MGRGKHWAWLIACFSKYPALRVLNKSNQSLSHRSWQVVVVETLCDALLPLGEAAVSDVVPPGRQNGCLHKRFTQRANPGHAPRITHLGLLRPALALPETAQLERCYPQ